MDVGPTIDISDYTEDYTQAPEHEETEGNEDDEVWGRLFPLGSDWSGIDLIDDDYTFGRSDDCDYCFEEKGCRSNSHFRTFSNVHFKIYKQKDNSNYIIFLQDKSTNGTFINGEKVGKNNSVVLNHDDEISLSMNKNKNRIEKNNHLPKEFKEKYTMSKLIGKGACGEVNLAFEKNSCKKFAVKIIGKKTFSVGPYLGRAAIEEVNIIKAIDHPCIIRVEDLFETPHTLYVVLELVEGGELFDRVVNAGKFTEPVAKLIFYQMLEAVKYLHEKGITHRDLKPENILLSCDDNDTLIKVTDFGLSKIVGEQSLMQTLCGTPSYLAPEVIKSAGLGGYDKAVDCWSMGVILYIMLGGYPPFSDEIKEYTLQDQICNGRYSFPKEYWNDVSKDAIDLITKLLTIDSQKRITTAEALNHPWMKDDKVINKAHSLMCKATDNFKIPPPKLGSKRSNSDEDSIQSSTKRPHLDNTPPPHICNNYTANFPDNTTIVRTSSVASTISTHSLSSE